MVERRVEAIAWIVWEFVDAEEGTWNRERALDDVLIGVPAAGTPVVLQSEYHLTTVETCSNGGAHRQYR